MASRRSELPKRADRALGEATLTAERRAGPTRDQRFIDMRRRSADRTRKQIARDPA
jgi:hypothetical protein